MLCFLKRIVPLLMTVMILPFGSDLALASERDQLDAFFVTWEEAALPSHAHYSIHWDVFTPVNPDYCFAMDAKEMVDELFVEASYYLSESGLQDFRSEQSAYVATLDSWSSQWWQCLSWGAPEPYLGLGGSAMTISYVAENGSQGLQILSVFFQSRFEANGDNL
jgi:hypothetical protein